MRRRTTLLTVVSSAAAIVGVFVASGVLPDVAVAPSVRPNVVGWPGALHLLPGAPLQPMVIQPDAEPTSVDGRGEAVGWADITAVDVTPKGQVHWRIAMALPPPGAAGLSDAGTVLTFGLVFETTGDGVADYIIGINNDAPKAGDFRVWVTDLASGEMEEQLGPPYGFPIEFAHPNEGAGSTMVFTFLGGSAPPGLTARDIDIGKMRFYAWTSVEDAGEVVAWDYAPDDGWLVIPAKP